MKNIQDRPRGPAGRNSLNALAQTADGLALTDNGGKANTDVLGSHSHDPGVHFQDQGEEGVDRADQHTQSQRDQQGHPHRHTAIGDQPGEHHGGQGGAGADGQIRLAGHQHKGLADGQSAHERGVAQDDLNVFRCQECLRNRTGVNAQDQQRDQNADFRGHQCFQKSGFSFRYKGSLFHRAPTSSLETVLKVFVARAMILLSVASSLLSSPATLPSAKTT